MEERWSARATASSCSSEVTGMATATGLGKGPSPRLEWNYEEVKGVEQGQVSLWVQAIVGCWPVEELHDGDALGSNGGGAALCF